MPPVAAGAVIAGLAGGISVTAAGIAFTGFAWGAFAGSLILGGLSYALTPKPPKGSVTNNPHTSNVAVRQSDLSRQIVYGHTRVARGFANMSVVGDNKYLHVFVILAEGELRAINEVWMDDYSIPNDWLDGNGNVTQGRYSGKLRIRKHLGGINQSADSLAVAEIPEWTVNHRLQGIAYLYVRMEKDQDVYPNGVPNISAIVEAKSIYDPRIGGNRWTTNTALQCADFIRNGTYGFGAFSDDIDETNVAAQANICDEIVDTQDIQYVMTANQANNLIGVSGDLLPYQFGDRVRLSVTGGSLPTGLSAGVDYYVIPYQVKGTCRIYLASSLVNAMNKVPINFTSNGSGQMSIQKNGEPRYHGGGIHDTETTLSETLNNLCSSMAGRASCVGGFWTLLAGAWRTPSLTFDTKDMRGAMNFKNAQSMGDSFNVVKGLFVSSINSYQSSDYPAARYQQFIDQDNGIESIKPINLPYTNRPTTGQRIAKIELFRGRQDIVFRTDFSLKAMQVQVGDNIYLDVDRLGWAQKPFEITNFSFDVNGGALVTRLTLRETAQQIFDWTQGEAIDYDPAPNTNLPNPFLVYPPSGVGYSSRFVETAGNDQVYTLSLRWDEHPDQFVTNFGDFEVQFKLSSDTEWRPSFFVDGLLTSTDLINSSVNIPYDLRIRARNNLGVRSPWATILGAVAGSSGGVGATEDWETFHDPAPHHQNWETFSDPVVFTRDWGYFV